MSSAQHEGGGDGPVIRDKRRIDPATGLPRAGAGAAAGGASLPPPGVATGPNAAAAPGVVAGSSDAAGPGDADQSGRADRPAETDAAIAEADAKLADAAVALEQLAERTSDLQRLQAEYVNYRRRVDRDRETVREAAQIQVLIELLPVLDDISRAREHGELDGAFASIAGALETTVSKLGLERYAAVGDPFDPTLHEALMHSYSPEVTVPTCVQVFASGYRVGPRVVRPARVAVAEPGDPPV